MFLVLQNCASLLYKVFSCVLPALKKSIKALKKEKEINNSSPSTLQNDNTCNRLFYSPGRRHLQVSDRKRDNSDQSSPLIPAIPK